MISSRLEKLLLWIIRIGSTAILFLPLLVYRPVLYPYVFSKILVFQVLVEIIFVAWLFLVLYAGKKYRPDWKNPLIIALTIFMGILFLTSLTGIDFVKSFWSTQERMTGIVTLLHFYVFFIVLISAFKNKKDWQKIIWLSLICSFLVGLYGLGQKIGLEFLLSGERMAVFGEYLTRLSSTLGNSIFLAVYSMLHIFLAGFLLLREKKQTRRGILTFLLLFNLTIMLLTFSRSVSGAFGLTVFFFVVSLILNLRHRKTKIISSLILIFFLVIVSGVFIFLNSDAGQSISSKLPNYIQRIIYFTQGFQSRISAWQVGWQGFKQKPILGWGWGNYNLVFNENYHPFYLRQGQESTWFDHSHNQVIDLLALTGVLGVLSYLAIFGVLFWLLFKKIKISDNLKQKTPLVIISLMFLAYFIQNLFVFDTPAPLIIFYFSLALVYFLVSDQKTTSSQVEPVRKLSGQNKGFPLPVFIVLVLIFLPWAMYKFNIEPFQQSRLGIRAIHTSKVDLKSGLYWYQKALAKPIFTNPEIRTYLAKNIAEQYQKIDSETSKTDLNIIAQGTEMAIAEYKKSVQEHPLDARHWLYLGQLYNLGARYNKEYIQEAGKVLHKALELSPQRQQIYFELARVHIYLKEYDQAIELLKQAVILDPQVKESRQNLESVLKLVEKQDPEAVIEAKQFLQNLEDLE